MEQPPPLPPHRPSPTQDAPPFASLSPVLVSNGTRFLLLFLVGAIGGAVVSAVAWIGGWQAINGNGVVLLFVIPGLKLAAGVPLVCFRRWRGLGAGLMVSIALGFLIFFGTCMTHLNV